MCTAFSHISLGSCGTRDKVMDDAKSSRKRKRISDLSVDLTGTKFGQLRQVLHELRPYVLEVSLILGGSR